MDLATNSKCKGNLKLHKISTLGSDFSCSPICRGMKDSSLFKSSQTFFSEFETIVGTPSFPPRIMQQSPDATSFWSINMRQWAPGRISPHFYAFSWVTDDITARSRREEWPTSGRKQFVPVGAKQGLSSVPPIPHGRTSQPCSLEKVEMSEQTLLKLFLVPHRWLLTVKTGAAEVDIEGEGKKGGAGSAGWAEWTGECVLNVFFLGKSFCSFARIFPHWLQKEGEGHSGWISAGWESCAGCKQTLHSKDS